MCMYLQPVILKYSVWNNMRTRKIDLLLFSLILIWLLLNFFPYFSGSHNILTYILKAAYGTTCHQEDGKLFTLCGIHSFLCYRCTGLYWGALVYTILIFYKNIRTIKLKLFLLLQVPIIADVIIVTVSSDLYSPWRAFLTGCVSGFTIISYIRESLLKLFGLNEK